MVMSWGSSLSVRHQEEGAFFGESRAGLCMDTEWQKGSHRTVTVIA